MKINSINLPRYRNSEHLAFMSEIREKFQKYDLLEVDILSEMYGNFIEATKTEDESFSMIIASDFTKQLGELDIKRDLSFTGFLEQLRCYLNYGEDLEIEMAHRIMIEYNDLKGDIRKKSYPVQSTDTLIFIDALRSKLQEEIETLSLAKWQNRIEQDNVKFMNLYNDRQRQEAEKDSLQRLKDSRIESDKTYAAIVKRINAGIIFNGEEKYKTLVLDLNVSIDYYNHTLAIRKGRAKAKKEKEEEIND